MKKYVLLCSVLAAMMIMTPLFSVRYTNEVIENAVNDSASEDEYISVMLTKIGKSTEIDMREYIIGCVAGEMPAQYHEEALKAQAVASFTFAQYIKDRDGGKSGADISDDSSVHQAYIDINERKKKWGDSFDKYEAAVESAVDAVLGQQILYDGKPIMAAYFDMCGGSTESAENIWGKKLPYLVSVTSDGDTLSPALESSKELTTEEFRNAFSKKNIDFTSDSQLVNITDRFDSGIVKTVSVSGIEMSGSDFRTALGLKSADFSVENDGETITIICRGSGHFVGMSQYGADYMARQGSSYREIILHYYPNTEIK